jgi:hypothetical protein
MALLEPRRRGQAPVIARSISTRLRYFGRPRRASSFASDTVCNTTYVHHGPELGFE